MSLICPNAETCPVYKNWSEQTPSTKLDVIKLGSTVYTCEALEAVKAQETGIPIRGLRKRLPRTGSALENLNCATIELLNATRRE